jgi:hypothetical protein
MMKPTTAKWRAEKLEKFLICAFFFSLVSASAQSHDELIGGEKKNLLVSSFFRLFLEKSASERRKNQKHSIDGQAMKGSTRPNSKIKMLQPSFVTVFALPFI